ncbi:MAG: hypothetical protein M1300_03965 [Epsilonproteobacteria bacterium]|nr:hypothetical protein [Campylobacterota bacterium]
MAMKGSTFLYAYALTTVLITSASLGAHEYEIGFFALVLGMFAIFIFYNYNHPALQKWVEKYF